MAQALAMHSLVQYKVSHMDVDKEREQDAEALSGDRACSYLRRPA